jgi:hypothetical protein
MDLFPSSGDEKETLTVLCALESANLSQWVQCETQQNRCLTALNRGRKEMQSPRR